MRRLIRSVAVGMTAVVIGGMSMAAVDPIPLTWRTVVNNGDQIPASREFFNRYDEPALNMDGIVVFRADGGIDAAIGGVYSREMLSPSDAPVICRADGTFYVPAPNNTFAQFTTFPDIARIDFGSETVSMLGLSDPVWSHALGDGTKVFEGTSGAFLNAKDTLFTGANMLGHVRVPYTGDIVFPEFSVPDAAMGTRFDGFVGAPAVTNHHVIVFNGMYMDAFTDHPEAGIYFRDVLADGGLAPTRLITNTRTMIPDQGGRVGIQFGWLSPPSAVGNEVVFVGVDYKLTPSIGGIYRTTLDDAPVLETLVAIGDRVPDGIGLRPYADLSDGRHPDRFTQFGDTVSFDGRYVAFWAAWGYETCAIDLTPPTQHRLAGLPFCAELYADVVTVEVPVNQGIFVHDTETGVTHKIVDNSDRFADFLYWSFVDGPVIGDPDVGPKVICPRPTAKTYVAVTGFEDGTFRVAFRAMPATCGAMGRLPIIDLGDGRPPRGDAIDAIFLAGGPGFGTPLVVVDTTMAGDLFDPEAPPGVFVDSIGIERDGLRGGYIAVAVGMTDEDGDADWAGLYLADVTDVSWCEGDLMGDSNVGFDDLLYMLGEWGVCGAGPCPADLDVDGEVGFSDLLSLLAHWGACP